MATDCAVRSRVRRCGRLFWMDSYQNWILCLAKWRPTVREIWTRKRVSVWATVRLVFPRRRMWRCGVCVIAGSRFFIRTRTPQKKDHLAEWCLCYAVIHHHYVVVPMQLSARADAATTASNSGCCAFCAQQWGDDGADQQQPQQQRRRVLQQVRESGARFECVLCCLWLVFVYVCILMCTVCLWNVRIVLCAGCEEEDRSTSSNDKLSDRFWRPVAAHQHWWIAPDRKEHTEEKEEKTHIHRTLKRRTNVHRVRVITEQQLQYLHIQWIYVNEHKTWWSNRTVCLLWLRIEAAIWRPIMCTRRLCLWNYLFIIVRDGN